MRCGIFPTGRLVWVLSGLGGPGRGVCGARRGLRHEGPVQEGERERKGTKERERVVGKAAGDECVFILAKGRAGR